MLTYRTRPRVFKFARDVHVIPTPALTTVSFRFEPGQAFGTQPDGGRTAVRGVAAKAEVDLRTGQYTIASELPLTPIELDFADGEVNIIVRGNILTARRTVSSEEDLSAFIEQVYYGLPVLLAPEFADPPIITDVFGTVNGLRFSWHARAMQAEFSTTTQDEQTEHVMRAWRRLVALGNRENRRLAAALHYFHIAARLERVAQAPGEFLAEALLNYAKILEVLFGPSTEAIRVSLRALGFEDQEIERDFIPAVILRSKFDVAHVSLVLLEPDQLAVLQRFADRAETQFRTLLSRVLPLLDGDGIPLPTYDIHGADGDVARILSRMCEAFAQLGDSP